MPFGGMIPGSARVPANFPQSFHAFAGLSRAGIGRVARPIDMEINLRMIVSLSTSILPRSG